MIKNAEPTTLRLKKYTGEDVKLLGKVEVEATVNNQTKLLPLFIVQGSGPALMGRNWLHKLQLDWKSLFKVNSLEDVLSEEFTEVFSETQGTIRNFKGNIHINEGARPRYFKPRPLPFAMKSRVEEELDRLENTGVISKVHTSEWAAPIVPIFS